ncbi:MAG: SMP-30/gluconolactonase/LRE family protein [Bradymonadia bacterium]
MNTRVVYGCVALAAVWCTGCDDGEEASGAPDAAVAADAMPMADMAMADAAVADDAAIPDAEAPGDGCWDDLSPGEVEIFYDGFPTGIEGGSEGVSFGADGRLYVGSAGTLWAFGPDGGEPEAFAEVPDLIGFAPAGDGFVVASFGPSSAEDVTDGVVYSVSAAGEVTPLATDLFNPNFVAMMPDGSALVSDASSTRIIRVATDGSVSEVIGDVPSPNGMAYSPEGDALYVASTFTPEGQVTRFAVDADGLPLADDRSEIAALGAGFTLDGVAVGASGAVYVAANVKHALWKLTPGEAGAPFEAALFAEGARNPASLAFGAGEGFDPCSVYVTQLFGSAVYRVAIGEPGAPLLPFPTP